MQVWMVPILIAIAAKIIADWLRDVEAQTKTDHDDEDHDR